MQKTLFTRSGRLAAITGGTVLAALLMVGCHDDTPPPTSSTAVVTPPAPASTTTVTTPGATTTTTSPDTKINTNAGPGASTGTDTALSDAVNTAIVHNKQMTGSRVEPVATAGVVTLTGQVQNQQQKALAEKTASQVPGVSSVKNKLIIVSTGGAKAAPTVITKTKTIVIHDQSAPPSDATSTPTTSPDASGGNAAPATTPDANTGSNGTSTP